MQNNQLDNIIMQPPTALWNMFHRENSENMLYLFFCLGKFICIVFPITVALCCALLKFQEYKMGNQTLSEVMT